MLTSFKLKVLLLLFILLITFFGVLGTLAAIPVFIMMVIVLSVFFTTFFGSSWAPTPKRIINKVIKETKPKRGQKFYDIGSGDGRLVIEVARKTQADVIGIEIDFLKWILSTIKIKMNHLNNARVRRCSFFAADIKDADIVFFYLTPKTIDKLQAKLKNLKKACVVVSYRFKCKDLRLIKELKKEKVYIYRI